MKTLPRNLTQRDARSFAEEAFRSLGPKSAEVVLFLKADRGRVYGSNEAAENDHLVMGNTLKEGWGPVARNLVKAGWLRFHKAPMGDNSGNFWLTDSAVKTLKFVP